MTGSRDTPAGLESWLPHFLQTADPQFPTGAYAHSFGLEETVALGRVCDADSLARFLDHEVAAVLEHQDLPYLRFAHEAALDGDETDLLAIDCELDALLTVREAREASARLGQQRLRLLRRLHPHPLFERLGNGGASGHQVAVAGVQAAVLGLPLEAALWAHAYQTHSQVLQASMKLIRIGQEGCQVLLTRCLANAGSLIEASLAVSRESAGASVPLLDIAGSRHATAFSRLFIS